MNRRDAAISLFLLALGVVPCISSAQQPGKIWRVGMLETTSMAANTANVNAFLKGMRELGYVEGQNGDRMHILSPWAPATNIPQRPIVRGVLTWERVK